MFIKKLSKLDRQDARGYLYVYARETLGCISLQMAEDLAEELTADQRSRLAIKYRVLKAENEAKMEAKEKAKLQGLIAKLGDF